MTETASNHLYAKLMNEYSCNYAGHSASPGSKERCRLRAAWRRRRPGLSPTRLLAMMLLAAAIAFAARTA